MFTHTKNLTLCCELCAEESVRMVQTDERDEIYLNIEKKNLMHHYMQKRKDIDKKQQIIV